MDRKNLIYAIAVLLTGFVWESCGEDYPSYDKELASVRFIYNHAGEDSVIYSFALHPGIQEDTVSMPLQIIGMTSPEEREVGVEVNEEQTTAQENENFVIQKCSIAGNQVRGTLKVMVRKAGNLQAQDRVVVVNLVNNEKFIKGPVNESVYRIVLTERMTKPADWPGSLGIYSRVKHEFVIKVTGKGTDYKAWTSQEQTYYLGLLNTALYEYNKEHPGNPLTDENGLLVTF